ncbi:hypothetical protein [Bradyrhizobium sp. USDA 4341]
MDLSLTHLVCSSAQELLGWRWRLILAEEFGLDLNQITLFAEGRVNVPQHVVEAVHRIAKARRAGIQSIAATLAPWIAEAPEGDYSDPEPEKSWPSAYFMPELAAQDRAWSLGRTYDGPRVEANEAPLQPVTVPEHSLALEATLDERSAPPAAAVVAEEHAPPVEASLDDIARELNRLLVKQTTKD